MQGIIKRSITHVVAGTFIMAALTTSATATAHADPWQEFDRGSAVEFADAHYNDPEHWPFVDDCTFFASEVLQAGMLPESPEWTEFTDDPTYAASNWRRSFGTVPTRAFMDADYLKNYLVDNGLATISQIDPSQHLVPGAESGDLIGYSWDNNGIINHMAVVVGNTDETQVDQHEPNALHKGYNWSSNHDDWITESTPNVAVYLIHITW